MIPALQSASLLRAWSCRPGVLPLRMELPRACRLVDNCADLCYLSHIERS